MPAKFAKDPRRTYPARVPQDLWPDHDATPRNGECNQADGTFKLLPHDGRRMFEWKWDDKHNKPNPG